MPFHQLADSFFRGYLGGMQVESKLPIHPSEQWLLEGQRGNANSGDFAPTEETSTPTLSINAQMVALVDALKAAEESRKAENEDFQQKLESIMRQVEKFVKSVNNLTREKEKVDMQVSFVEDRRDFHGSELLVEEDLQLITKLLSMEIN
ncbi:hypothetical protein Taro_053629, partial [Colocasia esculenta]|nr:hypothetical protein [Colocasia esculenta]